MDIFAGDSVCSTPFLSEFRLFFLRKKEHSCKLEVEDIF